MAEFGRANTVELLRASILCRDLPEKALELLASRTRTARFEPAEMIVRRGEPGEAMLIVVSGRVKIVTASANGGEVLHNLIGPRGVFGEISMLDGQPRSADAIALAPTTALVVRRAVLLETLTQHPAAALGMMTVLCEKLRKATTQYEESAFLTLPARLLRLLQTFDREYGQRSGNAVVIHHNLSQDELAASLGVSRESVSRQLSAWRVAGLIETARGRVTVHDLTALEATVDHYTF